MTDFTLPHSTHRLTLVDSPGGLFILNVAAITVTVTSLSCDPQVLEQQQTGAGHDGKLWSV